MVISVVKNISSFFKESIDGHIRNQILSELKELRDVSELLSTLEMAIGFLSTAGGDSETKVCDYLKEFLLLGDRKSNLKSKKVISLSQCKRNKNALMVLDFDRIITYHGKMLFQNLDLRKCRKILYKYNFFLDENVRPDCS